MNSPPPKPAAAWAVIPTYNNGATIQDVALRCLAHVDGVLVVDDGSTDADVARLFAGTRVQVLSHSVNRGKGFALRSAVGHLLEKGVEWMITLDGDGQHQPDDIPAFLEAIPRHPHAILVGARDFSGPTVPASSRFGRRFSNLWIRLETGQCVADTQSGFRAYPLRHLAQMRLRGNRYEFETDVLARAAWHGLRLVDVPVRVWYPERRQDVVSSFRSWRDNARISLVHARLCMRRLWPWPHRRLAPRPPDALAPGDLLRHPLQTLRRMIKDSATPTELGLAAALGTFLAVLPLVGIHTAAILYFAVRFRLNLVMALNVQHLYAPPLSPLACILLGHYLRHGAWMQLPQTAKGAFAEVPHYLLYWLIGSVVLAPVLAVAAGIAAYFLARIAARKARPREPAPHAIPN